MSAACDPRLQRLLGGEPLAALRKRLRRRFELAMSGDPPSVVRVAQLSESEYAALALLLGRSPRQSGSMLIDVGAIDSALRDAGIAISLRDALEQLDGPIVDRAAAYATAQARWSGVIAGCRHPGLAACLQMPAGLGLLKRLTRQDLEAATVLRERADAVLRRLPASGLPRAQLAAEILGDAHALDDSQPTATLVLAAWRQNPGLHKRDIDVDGEPADPDTSEERARDVWASAGVLVNELARPALFLNLPVHDYERRAPAPGEPGYVSLRMLLRSPLAWAVADRDVYVCENPNLLAIAADQLGRNCAPMVCTEGMPAAAQRTLLVQLRNVGALLRYHGDFDWSGLRIGNYVMREYGAQPWHFSAVAYEAAVSCAPRPGQRLAGTAVHAEWDQALTPMMQIHNLVIAEEGYVAPLLQDLRQ